MSRILILSLLIGTGALLMTVLMIAISVPLLGDTYQKTMFANSVLGCYGIGSPVSYYCLKQGEKFREANIELARLHAELEQAHAKLADKIRYDHLTGLLAREYFFGEFKDRRNASKTNSLLLIDADHFKKINDQWGHLVGDVALRSMTEAIRSAVRADDIVGRIGGEEFAVFLPGANDNEAMMVAERIRGAVEKLEFFPGEGARRHPLTVSIGGIAKVGDATLSQIMTLADRNLYQAKENGRNMVVLADEISQAA